jgi:hypothetical protein
LALPAPTNPLLLTQGEPAAGGSVESEAEDESEPEPGEYWHVETNLLTVWKADGTEGPAFLVAPEDPDDEAGFAPDVSALFVRYCAT